jgi:hypothetical protein
MITVIALIGAKALLFMYIWLISAMCGSYLSDRKGYGDRPGLASGLILSAVGALIWLVVPAKPESRWKTIGPFGRTKRAVEAPPEQQQIPPA